MSRIDPRQEQAVYQHVVDQNGQLANLKAGTRFSPGQPPQPTYYFAAKGKTHGWSEAGIVAANGGPDRTTSAQDDINSVGAAKRVEPDNWCEKEEQTHDGYKAPFPHRSLQSSNVRKPIVLEQAELSHGPGSVSTFSKPAVTPLNPG